MIFLHNKIFSYFSINFLNVLQTISSSSPWLEKLRSEVKHFEETKIDVEKLLVQARESDRVRSQMVILERRVQVFA